MIGFDLIEWDEANCNHIAAHEISDDEVEDVLYDPASRQARSRSSGRPLLIGQTSTGRTIVVVYERHKGSGHVIVRPVTACEIEG